MSNWDMTIQQIATNTNDLQVLDIVTLSVSVDAETIQTTTTWNEF